MKGYCVYFVSMVKNGVNFVYVGQGDSSEPRRRLWQIKRGINTNRNFRKLSDKDLKTAKRKTYIKGLTKNESLMTEALLIMYIRAGQQGKSFRCLNVNL